MITLSNGHKFTFCCASGALSFDGNGYFWEKPLIWLGILRPEAFTIITKTVTYKPRKGNLKMWCPCRCVKLIPGGTVNAVGLTNMGYEEWIRNCYHSKYDLIVSIGPTASDEAKTMAKDFDGLDLKGIEINLSCPNTEEQRNSVEIVKVARENTKHPIIVKLGVDDLHLIPALEPYVEAFDLINSVPWSKIHPNKPSPLAKYHLVGGVSGQPIREMARSALKKAVALTGKQIISGGGIDYIEEVLVRESLGAEGFSLGTIFLRRPWWPNLIVEQYKKAKNDV